MKDIPLGTVRVKKDLKAYEKTRTGWKKSAKKFPGLVQAVKLFKAHKNFDALVDMKNPLFLKGQVSREGQIQGARITVLPGGEKIDKAYSLFAEHLTFHDQDSHDHWDVLFQNKGGTWAYCYSEKKRLEHKNRKFKKVHAFDKVHSVLKKNVENALKDKNDHLAVPMYTLLTTYMRIGNETYYKAHGHSGLTTLTKSNVSVKKDIVTFNYFGKDGVPRNIVHKFPKAYIARLQAMLKPLKKSEFVFHSCKTKRPLQEQQFKKAFKHYCGKEFYPHIIRSHYATKQVQNFLKGKRKAAKEEVNALFLDIAAHLGHKKFVKKENKWKDNYSVTVSHYIQPELFERVKKITK